MAAGPAALSATQVPLLSRRLRRRGAAPAQHPRSSLYGKPRRLPANERPEHAAPHVVAIRGWIRRVVEDPGLVGASAARDRARIADTHLDRGPIACEDRLVSLFLSTVGMVRVVSIARSDCQP